MPAIEPYTLCPCGTGKKVKFCCPDLINELNQMQSMLEGGQRQACLDFIESVEKKHPDRASLVTTRAMLESALGQDAKAVATLEGFLAKQPGQPVALAELAVVYAAQRGAAAGIEPLQRALDFKGEGGEDDTISGRVVMAVARLGEMLLMEGQVLAARGHFLLAYVLFPQDEGTLQLLARFFAAPTIPLVLKNEQILDLAPDGVAWKTEFDAAVGEARRGRWRHAAEVLQRIAGQAADVPVVWQNLAVLHSWLADTAGTVAALRKYAALNVPVDDAVEAEAIAQLIDVSAEPDVVDEVRAVYETADVERLVETLTAEKRAAPFNWQSLGIDFGDQPPPRAGYFLLDRPIPATGVGIARTDIPNILGRILVFGKQTDRAARIEVHARRNELAKMNAALTAVLGDTVQAQGEPEKIDELAVAEAALSWSWRLPEDAPQEHIRKLIDEQRRESILNGWAATPLKALDGKSAVEAANNPALKIRLAATVSLVEQSFSQPSTEPVFDELRAKLNLPPATPLEAKPGVPTAIPYTRLHRLNVETTSDDDLVRNFQRALQVVARRAVRKLGLAIVARPSLKGKIDLAGVYGHLADLEGTSDEAIRFLDSAKHAAEEQKQSTAPWDLEEMELRLRRGEAEHFARLLDHIEQQHIREPGIAQALMQILYAAGIIGPDGRPRNAPGGGGGVSVGGVTVPGMSAPGAAAAMPAAEPGKLWTPGSDAPAAGGGKSGLWVPD